MTQFRNRSHAGQALAEALQEYRDGGDVVVLALPRGGVPVAFEVTKKLHLPLDIFVVRKLGVPGAEELAIGAIASGGLKVLDPQIINRFHISKPTIAGIIEREERELERRNLLYRGQKPAASLENRRVILIDDGLATGSTMMAALQSLRLEKPKEIIVAVPVAPFSTLEELKSQCDKIICLETPEPFWSVGQWYQDFSQTTDLEVKELLASA